MMMMMLMMMLMMMTMMTMIIIIIMIMVLVVVIVMVIMTMTFNEAPLISNGLKRILDISIARFSTSCRISGSVMLDLYERR